MLFPPHERPKIRIEGSLLGGVTYNLGDVRQFLQPILVGELFSWRIQSLDGDMRDGSHGRSWHRRDMVVSQTSCQLLSASTCISPVQFLLDQT